ncbi:MAG TPA: hypothetical protein VL475_14925 [Planctomycetaceae bacterium]|nr:hypothetical protein [Planctomycetaceae bacterium]
MDRREWIGQVGVGAAVLLGAEQVARADFTTAAAPATEATDNASLSSLRDECDAATTCCQRMALASLRLVEIKPAHATQLLRLQFLFTSAFEICQTAHRIVARSNLEFPVSPFVLPIVALAGDACQRCHDECAKAGFAELLTDGREFSTHAERLREYVAG